MPPRLFLLLLLLLGSPLLAAATARPPNVVLILIDDFGYECVSANGGESYRTPVMDQLAANGVRLDQLHVQPLCTPTRVALMTGIQNQRNYTRFAHLDPGQRTFGNFFKAAGYATCVAGKWQLSNGVEGPSHFGFDEHCLWQLIRRPDRYRNPGLEVNGKTVDYTHNEYGPDLVNDYALDFITRNREQPFFLYYPMMLTHSPYDATPDSPDYLTAKSEEGTRKRGHFADMVAYTDKLIGKVIARLDELQLREQTLVVLLGDNGTGAGTPSRFKGREVAGGKGSSLVWGTHVPGIVQWPGQLAAGKVCGDMLEAADILPTLCEAARVPVPAEVRLDGRSFLPQLRGEKGNPKDALYVWYNPEGGAKAKHEFAHNAHYKLYADGRFFDTRADDLEKNPLKEVDLSPEAAAARSRLQTLLDAHRGQRADYFAKQSRAFGGDAGESAGNLKKEKGDSQNAVPPDGAGGDPKMARFRKRDADHDGKITFAEFQDTISDKKAARARFDARDKDRDGILTVEEFLDASAPPK